jgi:hypothetical protein
MSQNANPLPLTVGDSVIVPGLNKAGKILMLDPDPASHPNGSNEPLWYLKFSDGTEGGGWRESELMRQP